MKTYFKFAVAFALICAQIQCFANDDAGTKEFKMCLDKADGVTSSMLNCIGDEHKRQDNRLNKAYKKLITAASSDERKLLQDAQRAWIKFRDADCNFQSASEAGGTLGQVIYSGCINDMTTKRAYELEKFSK